MKEYIQSINIVKNTLEQLEESINKEEMSLFISNYIKLMTQIEILSSIVNGKIQKEVDELDKLKDKFPEYIV